MEKGPHAGISGVAMVAAEAQIWVMGGFIPAGDETEDPELPHLPVGLSL